MACNCNNVHVKNPTKPRPRSNTPTYCVDNFIPAYNGENYLQLRDCNGIIRHKIYNNTLTVRYIVGNILYLKIASENRIIAFDFATNSDAQDAIVNLSNVYNLIRTAVI